ncbi:hypothetical protein AJ88_37540 [Mesorhizobium amorphae CCBAU 01583]|nr:hypothetical protein AJ88_37540 [Mesorhizobium amorphae CCBAU 01583]
MCQVRLKHAYRHPPATQHHDAVDVNSDSSKREVRLFMSMNVSASCRQRCLCTSNVVGRPGETLIQPEFPRIGSEAFEVLPSVEFECARRPHHLEVPERCREVHAIQVLS